MVDNVNKNQDMHTVYFDEQEMRGESLPLAACRLPLAVVGCRAGKNK